MTILKTFTKTKIKLSALEGYSSHVDKLAKLKDTGNGYVIKFYSYNTEKQDKVLKLDYDEAAYLLEMLKSKVIDDDIYVTLTKA